MIQTDEEGNESVFNLFHAPSVFGNNLIFSSSPIYLSDIMTIKEVVVYDKATGQKYFDVVDQNGNSVPNVPRKDPMFLKDYVINSGFTLARNNNLNNTLPVIVRNANSKNALSEY